MSDVKTKKKVVFSFDKNEPQPLTEGQKEILASIPVLPSPLMSWDERIKFSQQLAEVDQLRADNERLQSQLDKCSIWSSLPSKVISLQDDLQAHKAALEKARVALELFVTTWKLAHPIQRLLVFEDCAKDCSDALAAINELPAKQ